MTPPHFYLLPLNTNIGGQIVQNDNAHKVNIYQKNKLGMCTKSVMYGSAGCE